MRKPLIALLVLAALGAPALAQQQNRIFSALNVDGPPLSVLNQGPLVSQVFTDSVINVNVRGFPNTPVILLNGSLGLGANTQLGFPIDINPAGPAGSYASNVVLSGYNNPGTDTYTAPIGGELAIAINVPACTTNTIGAVICNLPNSFSTSVQAITSDPTSMPFGVRTTAAATANFTNGYQQFNLSGDNFGIFNFLGGFTFNYYGTNYTRAWVSSNGYVSFTQASTGFPNPSIGVIRSGTPRIMSFFNDLEPQIPATNPRIFAQQFVDAGVRKIRFVHQRLAEFGNATGPHGGEITIAENGTIEVFVSPQAQPSINTGVGITPGQNRDNGNPPNVGQTAFGRNLSADVLAPGGTVLGALRAGFELFNTGAATVTNPMDLISFNNPTGVRYLLDVGLPQMNGYIITM